MSPTVVLREHAHGSALTEELKLKGWAVAAIDFNEPESKTGELQAAAEACMKEWEWEGVNHRVLDLFLFKTPWSELECHWEWEADPDLEMEFAFNYRVMADDVLDHEVALAMA